MDWIVNQMLHGKENVKENVERKGVQGLGLPRPFFLLDLSIRPYGRALEGVKHETAFGALERIER